MSNDPNHDKRVSETYRSLANEQAPPELNRKILEMAAAERKRPLYSRWVSWTRPVAWAATITLCLAITLELSRDPVVDPSLEQAFDNSAEISPEPTLQQPQDESDDVATPAALNIPQAEEKREKDQILAEKTALARSSAKQAVSEPSPSRVRQSADLVEMEEEKEKRMDADSRAEAPATLASGVTAELALSDAEANECSAEARAAAESWLECIQTLEAAGNDAAALQQTDALKETFPDFRLP